MYCLAAVCLDASDAARNNFEEDSKVHREEALAKVEADIIFLLKCTTPYLLACVYGGTLAQLVYLRRALTTSSGVIPAFQCFQISKYHNTCVAYW